MPAPKATFRFLVPLLLAVMGALACFVLLPSERAAVENHLAGFPDADTTGQLARIPILAGLCFLPALAAFVYSLGGTLDRYIARQFSTIFLICLSALLMVWFLIDLQDNLSEFLESDDTASTIATFYSARSSAILLFLLPYSLLLSLLYCLGKLSSSRELIAMIQSGRGILRITVPLVLAGTFASLLCVGLNYHWAPVAEGTKDQILDKALGKSLQKASDVLYRNANDRRLWMVGAFPPDYEKGEPLLNVQVTTTREDGTLESRLSSPRATWNRDTRYWTFDKPVTASYSAGEPPFFSESAEAAVKTSWRETPWQLIKPGLSAAYLGVPDLNAWLSTHSANGVSSNPAPYLTHWHYRWALPFSCLVTVLLATPLAVHFSRRGPSGSIFAAVVLSALMLLISSISLVLGEAAILSPILAAWLPNLAFASLGLYLFHRRIAGRPIYQSIRALFGND